MQKHEKGSLFEVSAFHAILVKTLYPSIRNTLKVNIHISNTTIILDMAIFIK